MESWQELLKKTNYDITTMSTTGDWGYFPGSGTTTGSSENWVYAPPPVKHWPTPIEIGVPGLWEAMRPPTESELIGWCDMLADKVGILVGKVFYIIDRSLIYFIKVTSGRQTEIVRPLFPLDMFGGEQMAEKIAAGLA